MAGPFREIAGPVFTQIVVQPGKRKLRLVPVGILLQGGVQRIAVGPEQLKPVPCAIKRNVLQRPFLPVRHRLMVARPGPDPVRRALKDRQAFDVRRDRGTDLHPARSGADQRDPLAPDVNIIVPPRGMNRRATERFDAIYLRNSRPVELPDSRNHDIDDPVPIAVRTTGVDVPFAGIAVEGRETVSVEK